MIVDETTKKNLELEHSLFDQGKRGSLFWVLDETVTGMEAEIEAMVELSSDRFREIEGRLESVAS
jgi:DNA mismatch repair ATPase MutS